MNKPFPLYLNPFVLLVAALLIAPIEGALGQSVPRRDAAGGKTGTHRMVPRGIPGLSKNHADTRPSANRPAPPNKSATPGESAVILWVQRGSAIIPGADIQPAAAAASVTPATGSSAPEDYAPKGSQTLRVLSPQEAEQLKKQLTQK